MILTCTSIWSLVFDNMLGLINCLGLPTSDSDLDVLSFGKGSLYDRSKSIELHQVLKSQPADAESRMA